MGEHVARRRVLCWCIPIQARAAKRFMGCSRRSISRRRRHSTQYAESRVRGHKIVRTQYRIPSCGRARSLGDGVVGMRRKGYAAHTRARLYTIGCTRAYATHLHTHVFRARGRAIRVYASTRITHALVCHTLNLNAWQCDIIKNRLKTVC